MTDESKLKILCPLNVRHYADRVEDHVPIFKENFTIHPVCDPSATPHRLKALPASYGGSSSSGGAVTKAQAKDAKDTVANAQEVE